MEHICTSLKHRTLSVHYVCGSVLLSDCNSGVSLKTIYLRNEQKKIYLQLRLHRNILELFESIEFNLRCCL